MRWEEHWGWQALQPINQGQGGPAVGALFPGPRTGRTEEFCQIQLSLGGVYWQAGCLTGQQRWTMQDETLVQ